MDIFEVKVKGGRSFIMRDLTAREQMAADRSAGDPTAMVYYRVAMAIVSIDDAELPSVESKAELDARIDMLSGRESDALAMAYSKRADPTDDLKNG